MTPRLRLAWFGAVAFVAIFGAGELARWIGETLAGGGWWAIDLQLVLDGADRLASGRPLYEDPKLLYPPLAAVVALPLRALDPAAVGLAYAAAKLVVAGIAVRALGATRPLAERVLAFTGLVLSLPFLHDLWLGNANVLLAGAIAMAAFGRPGPRSGIALGVVAAVFAKPLLIPVLLWLLVFRRGVLAGTVVAGLGATCVGVLAAGLPAYLAWPAALVAGGRYAGPFAGNHGLTAVLPALWAPVALLTGAGLVLVLARRGPAVGLVWAVTAGILLAPYAGTYSALPAVIALPVLLPSLPVLALVLVAISPIATTHPLPLFAAVILLGALRPRPRPASGGQDVGQVKEREQHIPPGRDREDHLPAR